MVVQFPLALGTLLSYSGKHVKVPAGFPWSDLMLGGGAISCSSPEICRLSPLIVTHPVPPPRRSFADLLGLRIGAKRWREGLSFGPDVSVGDGRCEARTADAGRLYSASAEYLWGGLILLPDVLLRSLLATFLAASSPTRPGPLSSSPSPSPLLPSASPNCASHRRRSSFHRSLRAFSRRGSKGGLVSGAHGERSQEHG